MSIVDNKLIKEIKMLTLEQILAALKDEKPSNVATATGLSRQAVWKLQTGRSKAPSYEMIKLLSDYVISKGWNNHESK
jgi:transcriptional regulator with XRE-family HTH domain